MKRPKNDIVLYCLCLRAHVRHQRLRIDIRFFIFFVATQPSIGTQDPKLESLCLEF